MSRWEADYEILSDVVHAWLGGILGFYGVVIGWIVFATVAGFVGASFIEHPFISALVVVGVIGFLSIRYSWAAVCEWIRFVLVILLAFGLFAVGLTLAPYLTIAAVVGLIVWAVVRENRMMAAQAVGEEATRTDQAEPTRQQPDEEGEDDTETPGS